MENPPDGLDLCQAWIGAHRTLDSWYIDWGRPWLVQYIDLDIAAGRTLGGVSANSEEDAHFARLLNQFRCQTMRNVDLQLYVAGILPADQALSLPTPPDSPPTHTNDSHDDTTKHDPFHFHQLKQRAQEALNTFAINSGLTGRFEKLLMLDPSQEEETQMAAARRILRLEAALNSGLDVSPHDGFVDLIEDTGISVISVKKEDKTGWAMVIDTCRIRTLTIPSKKRAFWMDGMPS